MDWIMAALLGLGGLVCCLNFYLSFLRYRVHRMRGGAQESYRWVSGLPVVGSLFVAISLIEFRRPAWLLAIAIVLILIDTGGLHWFAGSMFYYGVLRKGDRPTTDATGPPDGPSSDG
ncbi:MAG: hypothetical protein ACYS5V_16095 [Planctomycetota bacterium]|jgi:hypothetical protein